MSTKRKVMIVEDSPTVRHEVKLLLEKIDAELVEAANEIGMFNLMEEYGKCVDLVIMDLTLKNENGFDLISKMKANIKYKNIPVLVLTERADVDSVMIAKKLGVNGYVKKPIQRVEFIDRIRNIFSEDTQRDDEPLNLR